MLNRKEILDFSKAAYTRLPDYVEKSDPRYCQFHIHEFNDNGQQFTHHDLVHLLASALHLYLSGSGLVSNKMFDDLKIEMLSVDGIISLNYFS